MLKETDFFTGEDADIEWRSPSDEPMNVADWETPEASGLAMLLRTDDLDFGRQTRLAVLVNRSDSAARFVLPSHPEQVWEALAGVDDLDAANVTLAARTVAFLVEVPGQFDRPTDGRSKGFHKAGAR